jgi:hypothetical protein
MFAGFVRPVLAKQRVQSIGVFCRYLIQRKNADVFDVSRGG